MNKTTKRFLILVAVFVFACTLAVMLSGCGGGNDDLEGKYIVTFDINGGILNYGTSSTTKTLNHAYFPNTYIVDPTTMPNYSIARNGYNFTGWYTSAECKPEEKWDFTTVFSVENLTLYAGWEKDIVYSFELYYPRGDQDVFLGSYSVSAGDVFEDWRNYANGRTGYTGIGFYQDRELTQAWDFDYTHPGGDADLEIPVYVKHIEGEWILVDSFDKLKSAIKNGNVYLTADIDCGGDELAVPTTYNAIFEGNGFKVSNLLVKQFGTAKEPSVAIFRTLGSEADIRNVTFENVSYQFTNVKESTDKVEVTPKAAALAITMNNGATVSNVGVSGTVTTNYAGELTDVNHAAYGFDNDEAANGIKDFYANITVNVAAPTEE